MIFYNFYNEYIEYYIFRGFWRCSMGHPFKELFLSIFNHVFTSLNTRHFEAFIAGVSSKLIEVKSAP